MWQSAKPIANRFGAGASLARVLRKRTTATPGAVGLPPNGWQARDAGELATRATVQTVSHLATNIVTKMVFRLPFIDAAPPQVRDWRLADGAMRLQKAGVIRYGRGQISVLDKDGLKLHSCECHAVIGGAYERLTRDAAPPAPLSGGVSPIPGHSQNGDGRLSRC